jgi:3'-5' exoribonuclease
MKDFSIADAAAHDNSVVTSYFALASIQLRDRKQGGHYLAVVLSDRTGQMEGRMWDDYEDSFRQCAEGGYVKAQGQISRYQGKFQITLQKLRPAAENEVDPTDFLPATTKDVEALWAALRSYVESFQDADLKRLLNAFLDDPEIAAAYRSAPAAKMLHHAWLGGLLEHVVALLDVCNATAPFYPEVNRDLLLSGAILHDIGKTRELSWNATFSYTIEGQLVGHISIAMGMLREKINAVAAAGRPFPDKLRILLEHLILSHHGKYEFGSPKLPMTPEAVLLNVLDDLEAKMQNMRAEFARDLSNGRSGRELTDWVRALERPLLNTRRFLEEEEK